MLQITCKTFDKKTLNWTLYLIIKFAKILKLSIKITPLQKDIKRYTLLRSSFVHKKHRVQYERRIYKKLIFVDTNIIEKTKLFVLAIKYFVPLGSYIKISFFSKKKISKF